jgi:uncharacterized protein
MGQPVVYFEVIGKDAEKLQSYYSELFGWEIDSDNPMNYGVVQRDGNVNADSVGIGGGVGPGPEGYAGHVTFYIEVPDVEAALAKAESPRRLAGDGPGEGDGRPRAGPVHRSRGPPDRCRQFRVVAVRHVLRPRSRRGPSRAWSVRSLYS